MVLDTLQTMKESVAFAENKVNQISLRTKRHKDSWHLNLNIRVQFLLLLGNFFACSWRKKQNEAEKQY